MSSAPSETSDDLLAGWRSLYIKRLKAQFSDSRLYYCRSVGLHIAGAIQEWCSMRGPGDELHSKLFAINEFVPELWSALTPGTFEQDLFLKGISDEERTLKLNKQRRYFWAHLNLDKVVRTESKTTRESIVQREEVKRLANFYLERPWMHTPYIDWVFVDALIGSTLVGCYELIQNRRGGIFYQMGAKPFAVVVWRVIRWPFNIFLGWILPGLICWWIGQYSLTTGVGLAVIYYGVSIIWLAVQMCKYLMWRIGGGKSFRRTSTDIFKSLWDAYATLAEDIVHVPSLQRAIEAGREKGITWDGQILCIIDNVAARTPTTWSHRYTEPPYFDP